MQKPPLDPNVADLAPVDEVLTDYDEEHLITYLRLLDAAEEGADWREVSRPASCCTATRKRSRIGRGGPMTVILRGLGGCQRWAISRSCERRADLG